MKSLFNITTTVQEIYNQIIEILPLDEKLRLATLILNDLTNQNISLVDYSDTWTEEDQLDLANFGVQYTETINYDNKTR
jgi:hypothetical protein